MLIDLDFLLGHCPVFSLHDESNTMTCQVENWLVYVMSNYCIISCTALDGSSIDLASIH